MSTSRTLEIDLGSVRSGSGPATWGQHAIWDTVRTLGPDAARYNVSMGSAVAPGLPVPVVLHALGQLLRLHDSLHTRLLPDDRGGLRQTVDPGGSLPVVVLHCAADLAEVEQEGRALLAELAGRPFDCAREWPIRVGLVEAAGDVRFTALALSHTAADAWGLRRVATDLTALVLGDSPDRIRARHPALQPLDEAAFQASDRGRRRDSAARQYWRRKLRLGSQRPVAADGAKPGGLPFPNAVLNSPALALAVERVAAGHRVSSSSVLLAAASAMTARITGSTDTALQVVVNNRFLPGLAHAVSTVSAEGLLHLTDADRDFPDVVRRTHSTSLAAYRHAYYDKLLLDQDIAQLQQDGPLADRSCFFNDTRELMPQQSSPDVEPATPAAPPVPLDLDRARSLTTLRWPTEFPPRRNVTFAVDALNAPGAVELAMTADSALLPRPEMERFLHGIEDLVITEARALHRD